MPTDAENSDVLTLLSAASNATGGTVDVPDYTRNYKRETRTLFAYGTWDSATAKLQISPDGTTWMDVTDASFTADGIINVQFNAPFARGVISGGLGSESITIQLV